MNKFILLIFFLSLMFQNCQEAKQLTLDQSKREAGKITGIVAFYNVENLFDTEDDPITDDSGFLPNSAAGWTLQRYEQKLGRLTQVLDSIGRGGLPDLIGLCEIENKRVLQDLIAHANAGKTHDIVQYDSPDARGIDVALIYNKKAFTPTFSEPLRVSFDFEPETPTRDILYVQGNFRGEPLHLFVNHWPSRRDGEEKSEPKRMAAAAVLRKKLDGVYSADPKAKVIIMGDFNDEPDNNSIRNGVRAMPHNSKDPINNESLYNMMYSKQQSGEGSYNHRGDWNMLDQFIVSGELLKSSGGVYLDSKDVHIYKRDWMLYTTDKGDKVPNKTYGGNKYYGGYSDHLPVYLLLRK
ncbi:MAG: hypothetical protein IPM47_01195 [Sphingobacteriales bacterium]|nr:MAG: hypothetical protein IPM47_01195 [Sphingobacteriales bacterium]